jgi:diguanylate cyclase (GGDEF)-like protein
MQVGVDEICGSLGWPVGHAWMVAGDESRQLEDSGIWHLDDQARFAPLRALTEAHPVRAGEGLLGHALASGRTTIVPDLEVIDRFLRRDAARAAGLKGAVAIPVRVGRDLVAVVEFFAYGVVGTDPELVQTLEHVALQLGRVVERERARGALEHQATYDSLTDLPNRVLLRDRLAEAIHTAPRSKDGVTLLLMDLDNFKEINDSFGHQAGDAILRQVGPRVRDQLRHGDTVARLGGDEFAALLPGAALDDAVRIAGAILRALEQPVAVDGQLLDVRASIGIAAFPQHGAGAEDLLQRADVAMYLAKRSGQSYAVYSPAQDPYDANRIALMADLRQALERSELTVFYQPKVNLMQGRLVGLEALVRWDNPRRGWVPPGEFIPLAERSGLIKRVTTSVLEHVLQDVRAWQRSNKAVPVAVNISMRDLLDPEFVAVLTQRVRSTGVDPHLLQLEITETAVMAEPERVLDTMARLQQLGIRFAIDDFGTGYSSLAYLQRLHVQEIKIDRSFVGQMTTDSGSAAIVRATVELGHSLGLEVVAEGVEDEATRQLLIACKCETAQGFLISRPLPAEDIERWLSHPLWRPSGQADTAAA